MGGVKQRQLELDAKGLNEMKETFVCSRHIEDYAIKDYINKNSKKGYCDYCKKSNQNVIEFEELMNLIMDGIMRFYTDAAEYMGFNSQEGGYQGNIFDQEELINDEIGLRSDNYDLIEDIIGCIDDRAWSKPASYYDTEKDILVYHWNHFKFVVKHQSRFLFSTSKSFKSTEYKQDAYSILIEIGETVKKLKLIKTLPTNTKLFRCRQLPHNLTISKAEEIASPPIAKYSNRMSPAGISMFYCAFDLNTAKLETLTARQDNCSKFTSAIFLTKENLKIVDLSELPKIPSFFDEVNIKNYYDIGFLHEFVTDLSKKIEQDGREHIDYVPTQVVTEFFRIIYSEKVDGIVYPSSRNDGGKACVLFFDHETSLKKLEFVPSSLTTSNF